MEDGTFGEVGRKIWARASIICQLAVLTGRRRAQCDHLGSGSKEDRSMVHDLKDKFVSFGQDLRFIWQFMTGTAGY